MREQTQAARTRRALEILCKWRVLLTGWQLGTRPKSDPVAAAVRDHREATLLLRAEVSALVGLLIRKGVIAEGEWQRQLEIEAEELNKAMARHFPGITANEHGLDFKLPQAAETTKGWLP
jgi:hypothetical protein